MNISGGEVECHIEDLIPAALDGSDVVEVHEMHRASITKRGVRPEEVVVSDEESGEGDRAVEVFEATPGAGVELVGAVEAFDDLLELSIFGAFLILVFQADDGTAFKRLSFALLPGLIVDGVGSGIIGGVAVADEFDDSIFGDSSESFVQSDKGVTSASGIRDVIGMDSAGFGSDGEPGVIPLIEDTDVRFISGGTRVNGAFMLEIELMAEDSGGIGVVENGLIRDGSLEDVFEHVGRHSCTESV